MLPRTGAPQQVRGIVGHLGPREERVSRLHKQWYRGSELQREVTEVLWGVDQARNGAKTVNGA